MPPDQVHKVVCQLLLVVPAPRDPALCRPVLAERRTGPAFRDRQRLPDVLDARPRAARGSVVFPCCLLQGEIGNGLPKLGIFKLQLLQPLHPIQLQAAIFLPSPVIGHLGHPILSNRIGHRGAL